MRRKLFIGSLATLTAAAGILTAVTLPTTASAAVTLNDSDVTANLWEWNFDSIAAACTNHLGPAGYGAVQVAPPQDSVSLSSSSDGAHPWWEVYQPTSYDVAGRLGNLADFTAMTTACHNAGVRVYVDAVINHMAGANNTQTTTYGGSTFSPSGYGYPAVPYSYGDFHHPNDGYCNDEDGVIDNWNDISEITNCELLSLSDLKTQDATVRTKIAGYLNKLIGYGVDGFRVDAAKHIAIDDFTAIRSQLTPTTAEGKAPYIAQEIFPGGVAPSSFTGNGDVLGFSYAYGLKSQFNNGTLSNLAGIGSWSLDASSDLTAAMVTNHDLERDGSTLRYQDGSTYTLANYFLLAYPYGQPFLYDGFAFSTSATGASPPSNSSGFVTDTSCTSGAWQCLTQSTGVKGMVGWRNAVKSATAVSNWTNTASNVIGFSRGSLGWFGVNRSGSASTATYTTGLANGVYCDRITGGVTSGGACAGTSITVSGGTASITIPANGAVAIDVNAKSGSTPSPSVSASASPSASASVSPSASTSPSASVSPSASSSTGTVAATFDVYATTTTGTDVYVVGSTAALGSWNTANAIKLSAAAYPIWTSTIQLPSGSSFEYKYIKKNAAGTVTWESTANRAGSTGTSAVSFTNSWNVANATAVTFTGTATTSTGQNVYVVGSIDALGAWNTANAIPLSAAAYPAWSRTVAVPQSTTFQYKYIKKDAAGTVTWESGSNRSYTTGTAPAYTANDTWK
ncbi:hypothetical protein ACTI_82550 [Actinoplanes sp. OR16]|uniref:carbohydrate-binding module family 20 domain-containing protein n=1 Tax=Actinoplanes sp. OR16 TaxID=946334 RepID=UPI000F6F869C|nr:carbohydrate-binding module family 20 domain-containing protein [Actinoplanes sp. OR16]BBH71570.1 hypothetical protein ACTI_82550 [Actinoplanes sp. OR16]